MGNAVKAVGNALGFGSNKVSQSAVGPNAQEQAYINQLQSYANGSAPSAADIQMQQGIQQASQQAVALAASQRGISPALAARYAAMAQANIAQGGAAQGAALRANEQQNYMNMLGQQFQSVRGGQTQAATANAQLQENSAGRLFNTIKAGGNALATGGAAKTGGDMTPGDNSMVMNNPMSGKMQIQNFQGTGMAEGGMVEPDGPQSHTVQFLSQALACGGPVMNYQSGGAIPGQAPMSGDNLQNDVVPIMASPGEIMLPRTVTMSKDPGEKAKAFVEKIKASQKKAK